MKNTLAGERMRRGVYGLSHRTARPAFEWRILGITEVKAGRGMPMALVCSRYFTPEGKTSRYVGYKEACSIFIIVIIIIIFIVIIIVVVKRLWFFFFADKQ